ncbi:hypothetical protein, partial [Salmonella enterica]
EPMGSGWAVFGVYYDYGNPYHQVMMSHQNWMKAFAGTGNVALAVVLKEGLTGESVKKRLDTIFRLDADRIFDNTNIHSHAMRVFDRTFS